MGCKTKSEGKKQNPGTRSTLVHTKGKICPTEEGQKKKTPLIPEIHEKVAKMLNLPIMAFCNAGHLGERYLPLRR